MELATPRPFCPNVSAAVPPVRKSLSVFTPPGNPGNPDPERFEPLTQLFHIPSGAAPNASAKRDRSSRNLDSDPIEPAFDAIGNFVTGGADDILGVGEEHPDSSQRVSKRVRGLGMLAADALGSTDGLDGGIVNVQREPGIYRRRHTRISKLH